MADLSPLKADLTESTNKVISNLTDGPTKEIGKTFEDIFYLVFGGIHHTADKRRLKYAHDLDLFKEEIEAEVSKIPEDKRIAPDLQVVGPALESAKYCAEHAELRVMFAKLIAASMNSEKRSAIHPAYSEIIKQLSTQDALVFKKACNANLVPMLVMVLKSSKTYIARLILMDEILVTHIQLDNLERLGLIKFLDDKKLSNSNEYNRIVKHPAYIDLKNSLFSSDLIGESHGTIERTWLGKEFYNTCVKDDE